MRAAQLAGRVIFLHDDSDGARSKHIPVTHAPPFNLLARTSTMAHFLMPSPLTAGTTTLSSWNRLRTVVLHALAAITLLALQAWAAPALAAPFTEADAKAVRQVVEAQLAALAADDAAKAFSYAAPNVREAVGSAEGFLAMVQRGYPVVYRPATVAFLKANGKDDDVIQRVQMVDADGESWLAIYSLQRQKNRTWRITGCSVVENKGRMA